MKTVWLKGLNNEKKEEVRKDFIASALTRSRLNTIISEKIEIARSSLRSKDAYDKASWAYQQADGIGYERALYEVISLIDNKTVDKE